MSLLVFEIKNFLLKAPYHSNDTFEAKLIPIDVEYASSAKSTIEKIILFNQ